MTKSAETGRRRGLGVVLCAVFTIALCLTLTACGDASGSTTKTTSEKPSAGSLLAIHAQGQLDGVESYSKKLCLGCHSRETIAEATEGFGGHEGFNPHAAHVENPQCTSCHSVDGTNTLYCNDCHVWDLPSGWANPEESTGTAAATK